MANKKRKPKQHQANPKPSKATPRKASAKAAAKVTRLVPSQEEIRARAFQIFMERGGQPGHALEDWVTAERELSNSPAS